MNDRQMKELGVRTIIGLTSNEELSIPGQSKKEEDSKDLEIEYVRYGYNEKIKPPIDFVELCEAVEEREKPVFVFCMSGMMASAFAIYNLMKSRNMSREVATMVVMKGRPEIEGMPAWLYSQLRLDS